MAGWRAHSADPNLLWLSYERMRGDPEATIEILAAFLGVHLDAGRTREIAELSSFARMRADESRFDHASYERIHLRVAEGQFVRAGEVGTGESLLDDRQRKAFQRRLRARSATRTRLGDLPAFLH